MTDSPCQSNFVSKKHKKLRFFLILKKEMICARISVFFGKYWNTFFDYKSWIRILNMKLEFEQIETLGIRSQRKTTKKL